MTGETPMWRRYLRFLGSDPARDVEDELRFHLEMRVDEYVRSGMEPGAARERAMERFGDLGRVRAACVSSGRDVERSRRRREWITSFGRDVRFAFRRLRKARGFSISIIASLALGIGVTTAVFALANAILLEPLPFPDPDRLVALTHSASGGGIAGEGLSTGTFLHYREHSSAFEKIGVYGERDRALTDPDGDAEQVRGADITADALALLGARAHLGRLLAQEDAVPESPSTIVISHELWTRRYGADPDIIGRQIEVDRSTSEIVGVMEPGFGFPHPETQLWWSSWMPESVASPLGSFSWNGIARLRPGVTIEGAGADLARLVRSLPEAYPAVTDERLNELNLRAEVASLKENLVGDVGVALRLLLGMAVFLLLITWANAANLCLARAERQKTEVAVARALGARGSHLARRFLSEGALLALAGGALGLGLAYLAVGVRFGFDPDGLPRLREVAVDGPVLGLALGLTLATAALLGAVSHVSARRDLFVGALAGAAGRMTAGRRERFSRRALVAGQFALALTLLIGSALMAGSFWQLQQVELGFEPEGAVTFRLPTPPGAYAGNNHYHQQARVHDALLQGMRAIPGVTSADAGHISGFPLMPVPSYYHFSIAAAAEPGEPDEQGASALVGFATPGYFRTLGIPILRGRSFQSEDTGLEGHGVVVSVSLARSLFGRKNPIGQRVRWGAPSGDPDYTVVGVAGDVPSETIRQGSSRVLYFPNLHPPRADTITGIVHDYVPSNEMYVLRTDRALTSLLPDIRRVIREVDPKLVMTQVGTLDALVADSMARARLTMLLLAVGAMTALLLGVIGIYGVLAYTVAQRTPEFGVRIALGADPAQVVGMVVRQGAAVALSGIAGGLLVALSLTRFLDALLYEVSPGDPAYFIGTAALLFLVGLAASYFPARRAGRIDPVSALNAR